VNDRARSLQGVLWELRHSPTPQQGLDAADVLAAAAARVVELETALRNAAPYLEDPPRDVDDDALLDWLEARHIVQTVARRVLGDTKEDQ
jgi:DNA-directed RNA polymerase sigma subunit (sigma70/sigma32)